MAGFREWLRKSRLLQGVHLLLHSRPPAGGLRWVLIVVFSLAMLGVGAGGLVYSARPAFCASCHEMAPEFVTWQSSAHSKVSCQSCHMEAQPTNVAHKVKALEQVYLHVTGGVPDNIRIKEPIDNRACETCHNRQRQVTAAGDLIIPHAQHIEVEGMVCVDCHSGAAHAKITERIQRVSYAAPALLQQLKGTQAEQYRPEMAACISCHLQRQAPTKCDVCHREIKTPASHQQTAWKVGHGQEAMTAYSQCLYCHDIALGRAPAGTGRERVEAVRSNAFCTTCHTQRPPNHDADWQLGHRNPAKLSKASCLVCHDQVRSSQNTASAIPACQDCHSQNHGPEWRKTHPAVVKQDGMKSCFTCHEAKNCSDCHEANWVGRV